MPIRHSVRKISIGLIGATSAAVLIGCATPPPPAPRNADGALAFAFADHDGGRHRLELPLSDADARAAFARYDGARVLAQAGDRLRPVLEAEIAKLETRFPDAELTIEDDLTLSYVIPGAVDEDALSAEGAARIKTALAPFAQERPGLWFTVVARDLRFSVQPRGRDVSEDEAVAAGVKAAIRDAERYVDAQIARARSSGRASAAALRATLSAALSRAIDAVGDAATSAIAAQGYRWHADMGVLPDYAAHATAGVAALDDSRAAFTALVAGLDRRATVGRLLAFFQSIPYDTLETRYGGLGGAGFALPVSLFVQNRGDCDTKSVAMASVLRMLAPELGVVMLLLEGEDEDSGHALLAVQLPPEGDDRWIDVDGERWTLIEPTGPAPLRIGEIAPSTDVMLRGATLLPLFEV